MMPAKAKAMVKNFIVAKVEDKYTSHKSIVHLSKAAIELMIFVESPPPLYMLQFFQSSAKIAGAIYKKTTKSRTDRQFTVAPQRKKKEHTNKHARTTGATNIDT